MSDNAAHVRFAWLPVRCDPPRGSGNVARTMTRTAAALALLAVGLAAGPAQAQLDASAVANVAAGATNNPLSVPDGGGLPKTDDEFLLIRAGVHGRYVGPRSQQNLSYTYAGTFYDHITEPNTNAHDLLWNLLASPTARTELQAQVDGTYGRLNSLNPIATLGAMNAQNIATAGFATLPTGPVTYVSATASLSGIYRPTAVKNWSELTTFTDLHPHQRACLEIVRRDAIRALRPKLGPRRPDAGPFGQLLRLITRHPRRTTLADSPAPGRWMSRHSPGGGTSFRRRLSWRASGGVVLVDTPGSGGTASVEPVVSGTAHYQTKVALAELIVSQSLQLNVYLGQPLLVDGAIGRLVIPLDKLERLNLVGRRHRPARLDVRTAARGRRGPAGGQRRPGVRATDVPDCRGHRLHRRGADSGTR